MTAAMINIIALSFVSAMLAAVMLIAWRSFGRPTYALVWAAAFGVATAEWLANLYLRLQTGPHDIVCAIVFGLCALGNGLLAAGYYKRLRPEARLIPPLAAAGGGGLTIATIIFFLRHEGLRDVLWLSYAGGMLLVCAFCITRSLRSASLPERAAITMLVAFALADFGLGALALGQGVKGEGAGSEQFRAILLLLYPLAFTGAGLFSVFLVAADLADTMRMLATSDELTGIYNRRGFEQSAERAIRNAQRQHQPLSVVIADIDRFKAINDLHGHNAGDRALRHFAQRLDRLVRRGDLIGRIGGEEFAILLVNTHPVDALDVVERIRRDVAAMPIEGPRRVVMTASFGIAGLRPGDLSLASLIARADRALYQSKAEGRDRVTSAEELEDA